MIVARIIGNCFLAGLFLLLSTRLVGCDLQVKILDQSGQICTDVLVGVPFQIHIVAKGDCAIDQIEFSSDFEICKLSSLGTIKSVTNVNRVVNHATTNRYLARIDQVGKYNLGPVKLYHGKRLVGELQVNLNVTNKLSNQTKSDLVELKVSKQQIYVGEQFEIKLRFYFNDMQLAVANLNIPKDLKELFEFEVVKEVAQTANYLEWQIKAFAKKPGKILLPAFSVVFEKVGHSNQFFMFHNREQHEKFSNAINLQVNALPPINQAVQGIGEFSNFTIQVDNPNLQAGKAAQLNLRLEGQGNWPKINLSLLNLPNNLQYYTGNVVQEDNFKVFEFVLQGVQKGSCQIPAQNFFYFDTASGEYKTLVSNSVSIKVLSINEKELKLNNVDTKQQSNDLLDSQIKTILEHGAVQYRRGYILPSGWFLGIGFLPILILLIKLGLNYYPKKGSSNFKIFKKQLHKLQQAGQAELLYSLFTNVLAENFNLPMAQVEPKMRLLFKQFYDELAAIAFSQSRPNSDLFKRAQDWLDFLENMQNDQI